MKVRVYIATTEGPSEIQSITREDPDLRSVVCLNGKASPLPISRDYDSFVREPTGVIQRSYVHPAYRVDVSHPITDGESWQLGLMTAHALAHEGELATKDDTPDLVIWCTGEVARDLKVGIIGHLEDKITTSEDLLADLQEQNIPVRFFMPHDNWDSLEERHLKMLGINGKTRTLTPLKDFYDVAVALGLPEETLPGRSLKKAPARTSRFPMGKGLFLGLALAVMGVGVYLQLVQDIPLMGEKETRQSESTIPASGADAASKSPATATSSGSSSERTTRPDDPPAQPPSTSMALTPESTGGMDLALGLYELRGSFETGCNRPDVVNLALANSRFVDSARDGLCGLQVHVTNTGEPQYLWAFAFRATDGAFIEATDSRGGPERKEQGRLTWPLQISQRDAPYRIVAMGAPTPLRPLVEPVLRQTFNGGPVNWQQLEASLESTGITVLSAEHLIRK